LDDTFVNWGEGLTPNNRFSKIFGQRLVVFCDFMTKKELARNQKTRSEGQNKKPTAQSAATRFWFFAPKQNLPSYKSDR
jgi:hypothetical protein